MVIVFDLDDTLYDLSEPFRRAHRELFEETLGEDCEELFRMSRIYSDEVLALEKEGKIASKDAFFLRIHRTYQDVGMDMDRAIADCFEEKYRYYQNHIVMPEEIKKMLDDCKQAGHTMALLTNGNLKGQGVKIRALNIMNWFAEENIFVSEITGFHKPALGTFLYVQEHLGVEPQEIWYVGDTYEVDVLGGKRAGWNVIWFNHRKRLVPEDNMADVVVHTAEELRKVLMKLAWTKVHC